MRAARRLNLFERRRQRSESCTRCLWYKSIGPRGRRREGILKITSRTAQGRRVSVGREEEAVVVASQLETNVRQQEMEGFEGCRTRNGLRRVERPVVGMPGGKEVGDGSYECNRSIQGRLWRWMESRKSSNILNCLVSDFGEVLNRKSREAGFWARRKGKSRRASDWT